MNINPKQLQKAMKQMGVEQTELDATEVIIKFEDREFVFPNPSVAIVKMMGQESFQITGEFEERALDTTPDINQEDVDAVVAQTGVSGEQAREALKSHNGDIAEAILTLQGQN